ncbi:MAG: helix-turn-helix domain-containing protein [Lactobacillaceae bacterium]|jgi:transcriptional regulator with XRE-family HTH domain|nr:helix-turn-helix domain-containing protein [Lactobacillaceae bacterium]
MSLLNEIKFKELTSRQLSEIYGGSFGSNLREARIKHHYTQLYLAERACVDQSMISAYENERRMPELLMANDLAHILDTSIDKLIND